MAKAPVAIKTASVLAFERKLATSDAVMYAGNWQGNEWQPIEIQEKAVRGTISNRLKNTIASDPTKLDAEIQKANLQRVDVASLPVDADTLKVVFTLRVLGNLSSPSVCNDMAYQEALSGVIEGYISEHGFKELALRYALNLANGRFLWRNRIGAEQIQVKVTANDISWTFNSHDFSLRQFDQEQAAVTQLAAIIEQGLSGKEWVMLTVEAQVRLGAGQEVFRHRNWCSTATVAKVACCTRLQALPVFTPKKLATLYVPLIPGIRRLMSWELSLWNLMVL